ncbi:MAG: Rid family hydrolase [Bacteroidales bacterium]|nr:Rid family hydrolase [Bacteroidales bacterium]
MEIHQILSASDAASLVEKEKAFVDSHPDYTVSMRRYILSARSQKDELLCNSSFNEGLSAVSFVIQPILGRDSIAVWIYLVKDCAVEFLWSTNLCSHAPGSENQTREILQAYENDLAEKNLTISDNCVRTWFFVDDIDRNYSGVVVGRRENFEEQGMTKDTHYLASTGICGGAVVQDTIVQMDALAIKGEFSQHYLYAPANFNPTHEYGVTFERGVVVKFGGESHILISGTASINNKGEIVHPGDTSAQTLRMWDNVEALLHEASSSWKDVRMMIVYLRNAEDHDVVSALFSERFGSDIPYVITLAPVCRPGWLIEMECIAIR